MKFVLPRVILGNRGDLASRWGLLRTLKQLGVHDVAVFSQFPQDIPPLDYEQRTYGKMRNALLNREGRKALLQSDVVLWAVGLDLQDDSSLAKLVYVWLQFHRYRWMGLRIWCLFQGAGPITTLMGRKLATGILKCVDVFIARDPGTFRLIGSLSSKPRLLLGQDAIFLHGFEDDLQDVPEEEKFSAMLPDDNRPIIGVNIRQWFHFASSVLPYEFARQLYHERSEEKMSALINIYCKLIESLRQQHDARIVLLSAYQPGVVPWEDDLPWLHRIKQFFADDPGVILVETPLSLPRYYQWMSSLDLMVGMRLHSSLTALRFGVPAINISYTLKGRDIYKHLGLEDHVIDLQSVLEDPHALILVVNRVFDDLEGMRSRVRQGVSRVVEENVDLLSGLLKEVVIDTTRSD